MSLRPVSERQVWSLFIGVLGCLVACESTVTVFDDDAHSATSESTASAGASSVGGATSSSGTGAATSDCNYCPTINQLGSAQNPCPGSEVLFNAYRKCWCDHCGAVCPGCGSDPDSAACTDCIAVACVPEGTACANDE